MATLPRFRATVDTALIIAFLAALIVPGAWMVAWPDRETYSPRGEQLAAWPFSSPTPPAWRDLPGRLRDFVRDHFGLRERLVKWNARIQYATLGVSPSPAVLVGKDGWLHFTGERSLDYHRAVLPFTDDELRAYVDSFVDWKRFLDARGIPFLVVVTPNKSTVYPETLPAWMTQVGPETRAETLLRALRAKGVGDLLDLRPVLTSAKSAGRVLYPRTESHWNDLGAFIGFQAIARQLGPHFPSLPQPSLSDMLIEPNEGKSGDLARLMGLDHLPGEFFTVTPKTPAQSKQIRWDNVQRPGFSQSESHIVYERTGAPVDKAVVFHDSFACMMFPFLAEAFNHVDFRWSRELDFRLVEEQCPDVVIFQMVERALTEWKPMRQTAEVALAGLPPDRVCRKTVAPR